MVGEIMFSKKFKKIGLKIAYYRKRKALKQMEVAEKAGISCSYLSKIETGKVQLQSGCFDTDHKSTRD